MRLVGSPLAHDSAALHVAGRAPYIDDLPEFANALHAAAGLSTHAHAAIKLDLRAVKNAPGVVAVFTAADLPYGNDISPTLPGDPLFANGRAQYAGQALFAVVANTREQARAAVKLAKVQYASKPAILTIKEALRRKSFIVPPAKFHRMRRGDADAAIAAAPLRFGGELFVGGQEHFYLESQIAAAAPQENGGVFVATSSQNPTEVQHLVAKILGLPMSHVVAQVRRMGGGFGGKETQAALPACIAALAARALGRAVKFRPSRAEDFLLTGKRHPFLAKYRAGASANGRLLAANIQLAANCGMSADLSLAIVDRAMFHADNAYYYPAVSIVGIPCKTHLASNTAFRGFGGPQGVLLAEKIMQDLAATCGKDALAARRLNVYKRGRDTTPYGQKVTGGVLPDLLRRLAKSADYARRKKQIAAFNRKNAALKKGLALTPVKFGISFTRTQMNQAGALLVVYADGTALINHGGTEMGQGLFVKVAQIVAQELGLPMGAVRCSPTTTDKVPNTSPTAASSGADLNGMAALRAAQTLSGRLRQVAAGVANCAANKIVLQDGKVFAGRREIMSFAELATLAVARRVSLSAAGFYATPNIFYDRDRGRGKPFYYYANGAAAAEVVVDAFTGEHRLLRVDILHDAGASLNPAIDIGQIEGGFAQGAGWLTSEELVWSADGRLQTVGPATYKIPAAGCMPQNFNVALYNKPNAVAAVHRSKAVGEPPLMLAAAVWAALCEATSAACGRAITLNAPATPERALMAIAAAGKGGAGGDGGR